MSYNAVWTYPSFTFTQRLLQSTDEDYAEMPISEFGKAMLRGMGWNEGKAIGKTNKGLACVCSMYHNTYM